MPLTYTTQETALPHDIDAVDTGLDNSNAKELALADVHALSVIAKDESGVVLGGAVGRTWGQCCELQQLWVDDSLRNRGTARRLIQDFEAQAAARGCSLVYLETFSFQAPVFYAKAGYASVHEFQGFTHGITKHIMQKKLVIP